MKIVEIDPRLCRKWPFADRSSFEYGDIQALADDIRKHGQIEPVYVREINDPDFKYEVIAGNRRRAACIDNNIPMKAIISNVSDLDAAIIQTKENDKIPLSDYSRGMSLYKLYKQKNLTQEQLANISGTSRGKTQRLLAYSKVKPEIWAEVHNMSRVSPPTADIISILQNKSPKHLEALISIADDIRKGAGARKIKKLVANILGGGEDTPLEEDLIQSKDGQVFATWKNDRLHIQKNLKFDKQKLNEMLLEFFTDGRK